MTTSVPARVGERAPAPHPMDGEPSDAHGSSQPPPADPLFVLGPPRSFTSVVGAMIGRHPDLYGLPELQIATAETVGEWWTACARATFPMAHGLLRAVAELVFGEQTEDSIRAAGGWLRRRNHVSTGLIVELLADRVRPRVLVEKSPSTVYQMEALHRLERSFPHARYIHLTRHPVGQGLSVMKSIREMAEAGPVPYWMIHLASFPDPLSGSSVPTRAGDRDPQFGWYALHSNILEFLSTIPPSRQLHLRAEDVLCVPDTSLPPVARWLGVRTDPVAIAEMQHPERSPFARFGPEGARLGNDANFLRDPFLRPGRVVRHTLAGALPWRDDGCPLAPDVRRLAGRFGYR